MSEEKKQEENKAEETTSANVLGLSDKAMEKQNVDARKSQAKVGKVRSYDRKNYTITKDSNFHHKGEVVPLGAATAEVYRTKGLIAKSDKGEEIR